MLMLMYCLSTGMHWIGNIVNMLLRRNINYTGTPLYLDFDDLEDISRLKETRVIGSHFTVDKLPEQLKQGNGRMINISRNPKDCVVSHFTFFKKFDFCGFAGDFDSFVKFFYKGHSEFCFCCFVMLFIV